MNKNIRDHHHIFTHFKHPKRLESEGRKCRKTSRDPDINEIKDISVRPGEENTCEDETPYKIHDRPKFANL